ncbi:MAG: hypothetical protein COT81_03670 [Candidatus Buchananbacteria bacterium CG10_big_fil_rev_8_21_14_0_10_42_9]|uniref:TraC-like domain-containing protein n=1 Tax=Candidatus Buchananbacteria bacterium CG10_big_fil_rev_8_21_14_0_10_42_9 TaxID=1974526 RepID=A0A2H0W0T5_9BACT|nr:MAG: hypothetical protein COT81_03670 [Candidatus Buchananbacteria bacterium CG10_big_fil_rev_8_21_14_0_10_42_9]
MDIAEIRDNVVVMRDGTLRTVLLVSSINFALKSEDEQNAIISGYVTFLNAVDFPVQIVIQSRKLDIDGYLGRLEKSEKEQTNELLRMQIADYRQYVSELVELGDIMTKRFYLVIPYDPVSDKSKGFFKRFIELFRAPKSLKLNQKTFNRRKHELDQRVAHVSTNLQSMGLQTVVLDTQSLIELYYNTYNPDVSSRQKLSNLSEIDIVT